MVRRRALSKSRGVWLEYMLEANQRDPIQADKHRTHEELFLWVVTHVFEAADRKPRLNDQRYRATSNIVAVCDHEPGRSPAGKALSSPEISNGSPRIRSVYHQILLLRIIHRGRS